MLREGAHRRFGLLLRVGISGSSSQPRCPSLALVKHLRWLFSAGGRLTLCFSPARPPTAPFNPIASPSTALSADCPPTSPPLSVALLSLRSTPRILLSCCKAACTDSFDAKRQGTLLHITAAQPQPKADLPSTTLDPERALRRWRRTSSIRRAYSAGVHHCR